MLLGYALYQWGSPAALWVSGRQRLAAAVDWEFRPARKCRHPGAVGLLGSPSDSCLPAPLKGMVGVSLAAETVKLKVALKAPFALDVRLPLAVQLL